MNYIAAFFAHLIKASVLFYFLFSLNLKAEELSAFPPATLPENFIAQKPESIQLLNFESSMGQLLLLNYQVGMGITRNRTSLYMRRQIYERWRLVSVIWTHGTRIGARVSEEKDGSWLVLSGTDKGVISRTSINSILGAAAKAK